MLEDQDILSGVLREFAALCAIPRPSGHEEAVSAYLLETLSNMGLSPTRDEAWNVRCDVPATPGLSRDKRLVLQAHSDMVCVGAADYRPLEDPVRTEIRDGWLQSDGRSSLGADCGIGLAAAMYLIRSGMPHGPLRLIFTADEERGLNGAKALNRDCLTDCDGLINLDGFHFGSLLISSAGGTRQIFKKQPEVFFPMLDKSFNITLSGLIGGHSGDDIGLGRGNAAQWMVWLLQSLEIPYELASIDAGTAHNAIPTEAVAQICIDGRDEETLRETASAFLESAKAIYGDKEPGMTLEVTPAELPQWVLHTDQRDDLLALAGLIQCGVWDEHPLCPGCVGDSCSMGKLYADSETLTIYTFLRSCSDEKMAEHEAFYKSAAEGFGFAVFRDSYGAWPGVAQDPLTDQFLNVGKSLGIRLTKGAVHVGLEASVFHEMAPNMPMVSVGMEIENAHSVSERVRLDTVVPFVRLLGKVAEQYGMT